MLEKDEDEEEKEYRCQQWATSIGDPVHPLCPEHGFRSPYLCLFQYTSTDPDSLLVKATMGIVLMLLVSSTGLLLELQSRKDRRKLDTCCVSSLQRREAVDLAPSRLNTQVL